MSGFDMKVKLDWLQHTVTWELDGTGTGAGSEIMGRSVKPSWHDITLQGYAYHQPAKLVFCVLAGFWLACCMQ